MLVVFAQGVIANRCVYLARQIVQRGESDGRIEIVIQPGLKFCERARGHFLKTWIRARLNARIL